MERDTDTDTVDASPDPALPLTAVLLAAVLAVPLSAPSGVDAHPAPAHVEASPAPEAPHAHDGHAYVGHAYDMASRPRGAPRAHDEATLEAAARVVEAGGALDLTGEGYTAGESYLLRLEGALRSYDLEEVRPDTAGHLAHRLRIPARVREGRYGLAAVAPDGDVVARLDLTVLAASGGGAEDTGAAGQGGAPPAAATAGAGPGPAEARSDDIPVQRSRSGAEWGVIGLLVGLAGGLGVGLLRKGRA